MVRCSSMGIGSLLLWATVLSLSSPRVEARESTLYAGVGYSRIDIDGLKSHPKLVAGLLGWSFNEYLSLEGRFGTGVGSATEQVVVTEITNGTTTIPVDVDIKHYYGGFLRGTLPIGERFGLYALAGYGSGKVEVSSTALSISDSESSGAYGAGMELSFGDQHAHQLGVEWAKYFEDAEALSVIYRFKF